MKTSAQRVIAATNSWLYAQTRRSQHAYDTGQGLCLHAERAGDQGAHRAHLPCRRLAHLSRRRQLAGAAHRGPSRRRLVGAELSRPRARRQSRRSRSTTRQLAARDGRRLRAGDRRRLRARRRRASSSRRSTTAPATSTAPREAIVEDGATSSGSADNLTVQIVRVDDLPRRRGGRAARPAGRSCRCRRCSKPAHDFRRLPDRARAARQQPQPHLSRRRHRRPRRLVVLKIPSIDLRDDPAYLERFMMEEWVARRINSAHVLKPRLPDAQAQLPLRRHRIRRRPDAGAVDDRQPAARPRDGARHRRADRRGPAGLPPHGDAAPGPAAREHHDRPDRHGEDHRLRLDRVRGRRRGRRRRPTATASSAPRNTPRRNISSARAARRARTSFRWASSPTRC